MKAQITTKRGKGTAVNEVQRPSSKKYLSEYDRIFAKPTKLKPTK
jgi:hypothetical protein